MILLDPFPLWAVYVVTVVALVLAEIGFRLGLWLQRRDPDSGTTAISGAAVGGCSGRPICSMPPDQAERIH